MKNQEQVATELAKFTAKIALLEETKKRKRKLLSGNTKLLWPRKTRK